MTIVAQMAAGWSIGSLAIAVVVILAVCALVMIAVRAFQIPIPGWVYQVVGVVIVAVVIIAAIKLISSM